MFEFDTATKKKLQDLEFVESASTNVKTQNALLEALEEDASRKPRFKNATEMFTQMQKEWEDA